MEHVRSGLQYEQNGMRVYLGGQGLEKFPRFHRGGWTSSNTIRGTWKQLGEARFSLTALTHEENETCRAEVRKKNPLASRANEWHKRGGQEAPANSGQKFLVPLKGRKNHILLGKTCSDASSRRLHSVFFTMAIRFWRKSIITVGLQAR